MDSPQKVKHTKMQILTSDEEEAEACIQQVIIHEDEFRKHHGTPVTRRGNESDGSGIKQLLPQLVQTPETLQINRRAQLNLSTQQPKRLQFPQGEQNYATADYRRESDPLELQSDAVRMSMEQVNREVFTPRRPITIRRKDYTEPKPEPPFQFKERALPLVTVTSNGKFEINQEVVQMMEHVRGPIGVVAVAGMYRTGKSYLLNRLLLNRKRGFNVGPSINPCTKGIWIWGTPLKSFTEKGEPCSVLIVDSEGMGGFDEDNNHDMRIFSLALLLSSYFIYNSMSQIDENALQNLGLVVNLTKHIQTTAGQQKELDQYLPTFMWVVRDFALQLQDEDGKGITDREYLETALQQKGNSKTDPKNQIRAALLKHFKRRDCCTMIRPSVDEQMLQKLEEMELEDLRTEFVEQVVGLRKKVLGKITVKKFNGTPMDGSTWIGLLKQYTQAFNEDRVPNVESSWSYICRQRAEQSLIKATQHFELTLEEIQMPFHQDELNQYLAQSQSESLEMFNQSLLDPAISKDALRRLQEWLRDRTEELQSQNLAQCYDQAQNLLQESFQQIDQLKSMLNDPFIFQQIEHALEQLSQYYDEHCFQFVDKKLCFAVWEGRFYKDVAGELARYWGQECKQWDQQMQQLQEDWAKKQQRIDLEIREEMQREKLEYKGLQERGLQMEIQRWQQIVSDKEHRHKEVAQGLEQELGQLRIELRQMSADRVKRIEEAESQIKELARQHKQELSQIDMESSLSKHQIQYLQEQLKQSQHKQEQQQEEYLVGLGTLQQQQQLAKRQWEDKCKQVEQQVQSKDELVWSLEQQLAEIQQSVVVTLESFQLKEMQYIQQLEELKNKPDCQESTMVVTYQKQFEEGLVQIKLLQEKELQLKHEHGKESSLKDQKIQFLQVEVQEVREQLGVVQGQHYGVIQMLEGSPQKEHSASLVQELERQLDAQYNELQAARERVGMLELESQGWQREYEHADLQLKELQGRVTEMQESWAVCKQEASLRVAEMAREIVAKEGVYTLQIEDMKQQHLIQLQQEQCRWSNERDQVLQDMSAQHALEVTKFQKQLQDEKVRQEKRVQQLILSTEQQQQQLIDLNKEEVQRLESSWDQIRHRFEQDIVSHEQKKVEQEQELVKVNERWQDAELKLKKKVARLQDELGRRDSEVKLIEIELESLRRQLDEGLRVETQLRQEIQDRDLDQIASKEMSSSQIHAMQSDLDSLQTKYELLKQQKQQSQDDLQQVQFQSEKHQALQNQEISFQKQRYQESQHSLEQQQKHYELKLEQQRSQLEQELLTMQKSFTEAKEESIKQFNLKRKQNQQLEHQVSTLTKELLLVQQSKDTLVVEMQQPVVQSVDLVQVQQLEVQLQDVTAMYDKDTALWSQKLLFLESQRDSYKLQKDEQQRKFEMLIEQLGKRQEKEKVQNEINVKNLVKIMETRQRQQVQEIQQAQQIVCQEWQMKCKRLEHQIQKQLEKEKEWLGTGQQDDLQAKLDASALEKERIVEESQKTVQMLQVQQAKDKDIFKFKVSELERKLKEVEQAKKTLFYSVEQERAQWLVQADQYLAKVQELQDQIFGLERTRDLLRRENDKLKGTASHHGVSPVPRFTLNTSQIKPSDSQGQGANKIATKQSTRYKMPQHFASTEDN